MKAFSAISDATGEADHRIANSLALLTGFVQLEARALGQAERVFSLGEVRALLDSIAARIATMGQLHRLLAQNPGADGVALGAHLREVGTLLAQVFSATGQAVEIAYGGPDCELPVACIQPLTLIVCEVLTNAMKYAHPTGGPVRLRLEWETDQDGMLFLTIADDGVGLPEGFDPERDGGVGLRIVRALAGELGAKLHIESDDLGVTVRLAVPGARVDAEAA